MKKKQYLIRHLDCDKSKEEYSKNNLEIIFDVDINMWAVHDLTGDYDWNYIMTELTHCPYCGLELRKISKKEDWIAGFYAGEGF